MEERPTRRQALCWLGSGLGSVALGGCPERPLPRFHTLYVRLRQREYRVRLDRQLRSGPLQLNETLTLRRYQGHASPLAREAQLIHLADTREQSLRAYDEMILEEFHPDRIEKEVRPTLLQRLGGGFARACWDVYRRRYRKMDAKSLKGLRDNKLLPPTRR